MNKIIKTSLAVALLISCNVFAKINLKGTNKVKTLDHIDLSEKTVLVMSDTVTDYVMEDLSEKMLELVKEKDIDELHLIIDSYGGSVDAGIKLINTIDSLKGQKKISSLQCYIYPNAMSMAQMISSYCDKVMIHKFGTLMLHEASYGLRGSQSQIKTRIMYIEKYLAQIWKDVAKNYGLSVEELNRFMNLERFLDAQETVQHGFADAIFNSLYHEGYEPEEQSFFSLFSEKIEHEKLPDIEM